MGKLSIVAILLAIVATTACKTSPESALRKNTEALLMSNLNDASSYEFVGIEDLRPLTVSDTLYLYYEIELKPLNDTYFELYSLSSKRVVNLLTDCGYYAICDDEALNEAEAQFSKDSIRFADQNVLVKDVTNRAALPESKQIEIGYKALFRYRASNAAGAKELREMRIYADNKFNLYERFIEITP